MTATNDGIIHLKGRIRDGKLVALLDHEGKELGAPVTSIENEFTGGTEFSGTVDGAPAVIITDDIRPAARYGVRAGDTSDSAYDKFNEMFANHADDGGGVLEFGPGGYYVDGMTINVGSGIAMATGQSSANGFKASAHMRGVGRHATRIHKVNAGGLFTFAADDPASQIMDVSFSGMGFKGPGVADSGNYAMQFGGVTVDKQSIIADLTMHDLYFSGFHTHVRAEDITGWSMTKVLMDDFRYGIEANYNIDILTVLQSAFGDQGLPIAQSVTTTSGSPTITCTALVAEKLRVGMVILSDAFPLGSRVLSVDVAGSAVLSENATASGARTVDFAQGTVITFGGGPWVPAANAINTSRGDCNAISFIGNWFMRTELAADIFKNSTSNIKFDTNYSERGSQFIRFGDAANNTQSVQQLIVDNHFFSQPDFRGPAIEDVSQNGADCTLTMRNCRRSNAGGLPAWGAQPWIKTQGLTDKQIDWQNNSLYTADAAVPQLMLAARGINLGTNSSKASYSTGCKKQPGYTEVLTYAATLNLSCSEGNTDQFTCTLTGNTTVAAASTTNLYAGFKLQLRFTQDATGGRTVTWNAAYKGVTLAASGTANQKAVIEFAYDGSNFVQTASSGWY